MVYLNGKGGTRVSPKVLKGSTMLKYWIIGFIFILLTSTQLMAVDVKYLQEISVTVQSLPPGRETLFANIERPAIPNVTEASGVLISKITKDKQHINFVLTVAHEILPDVPIFSLKKMKDGTVKSIPIMPAFRIIQKIQDEDYNTQTIILNAKLFYVDRKADIMILLLEQPLTNKTIDFAQGIVPLGTDIYHMGSCAGIKYHDTLTKGMISYINRTLNEPQINITKVDQVSAGFMPGSSGGGIFLTNNQYAGIAHAMFSCQIAFITPSRTLHKWSIENNITWLFNQDVEVPTLKEIKNKE